MLIFENQHQAKLLKENRKTEGVTFCELNSLEYLIYKDFNLFKEVDGNEPIKSFNVSKRTLIYVENKKENEFNINMIINRVSEIFKDLATKQNSDPIIPLMEEEKSIILNFIKNNYKTDYDECDFGFTIIAPI